MTVVEVLGAKGVDATRRLKSAEALLRSGLAPASAAYWRKLEEELDQNTASLRDYILPGLIIASRDPDSRVRNAAVAKLGAIGTREATSFADSKDPAASEQAQFSAYYPMEAKPEVWYPLYGYVFRSPARTLVQADATTRLKTVVGGYGERDQLGKAAVVSGAHVRAALVLDGIVVNPSSARMAVLEDWQCFEFRICVPKTLLARHLTGTLTFSVEGVIIADVSVSVVVVNKAEDVKTEVKTRSAYDAVFCSYSHKDDAIVRRVEAAYKSDRNELLERCAFH